MNIPEGINIAYKICCVVGTILLICVLFEQYFSNEDTSIVEIKSFSETNRNSFPEITLCLISYRSDGLYNNTYILSSVGKTGKQYQDALLGNSKMVDSSELSKLNFEMATIKLQNYLTKFRIKDSNDNHILEWKKGDAFDEFSDTPLDIYYQDPLLICNAYHPDANPDINLESFDFYFSIPMLQGIKRGVLYLLAHHKNQLVRTMRYLYKIEHFEGINYNYSNNQVTLDLDYISIIKSRKDGNAPCDEYGQDDDKKWMDQIVALIGCFPPYWKRFYSNVNNFIQCNTTEQLKNMSIYLPYHNERMIKSILKMYHPPCEQMRVLANSNIARYTKKNVLKIRFHFG